MRHAVAFVLCLAAVAAAGSKKPAVRIIDGKEVVGGPAFKATPLVEVRDLKFYACKLKSNGADCSIITGYAIPRITQARPFILTLDIDLYEVYADGAIPKFKGTVRTQLDRPKGGQPTRFCAIGPPWFGEQARGTAVKPASAHYIIRASVQPWRVPKPGHLESP